MSFNKNNDWFAVLMNVDDNENVNLGKDPFKTLYSNGITPDNTGIKNPDYYKNIPQVQQKFTNNSGEFDEASYKQFYDSALRSYNEFSEMPFVEQMLDEIGTTPYDSSRIGHTEKRVKNLSAVLAPFHDRNRSTYGTANLWESGSATFSDREVAQANFVRDENGNKLDWTPNDKAGIFKSLFNPSLVYASYDEDVYDENGRIVHYKGELKLDENGDPYTELLGNRESFGKDIVKWTDTFSVEGTFANKIDIFDSDSLEKSIWKTTAKTAVMFAPYLITPVGQALGWINAAIGLTTAMPNLLKSLNGLVTGDNDTEFAKSMTWLENVMGRFQPSVSDKARGRFFSAENLGDLIVSSAGQLYSQRQIANSIYNWAPFSSASANKKFAEIASTGYMAMTSATDAYATMKEAGANDRMASIGSLLTMAGFYTLLQHEYFKGKLFEGSLLDEDQRTLYGVKKLVEHAINKVFPSNQSVPDAKGIAKVWQTVKEGLKKVPKGLTYETPAFISRGVNEGLEEMTEEMMTDTVKGLSKALEAIGIDVTEGTEPLDYGMTVGNTLERWGTSFLGGFLGGAVFEGITYKELAKSPEYKRFLQDSATRRMFHDVARGNANKWRDVIKKRGQQGKNGNKNLSASYETLGTTGDGTGKVYKTGTETDNQNLAITNALLALVDEAELIYSKYNLIFTDEELTKKVLGHETIKQRLRDQSKSEGEYVLGNILAPNATEADAIVDALLDSDLGGATVEEVIAENVLNDVNSLRDDILNIEKKIRDKLNELPAEIIKTEEDRKKAIKNNSYLKNLAEERDALVEEFNEIVQGKHADHFFNQTLFFLTGSPAKYWNNLGGSVKDAGESVKNIETFAKLKYKVADFNSIKDEGFKKFIEDRYDDYKQNELTKLRNIASLNLSLSEILTPTFDQLNKRLKTAEESSAYIERGKKRTIGEMIGMWNQDLIGIVAEVEKQQAAGLEGTPEFDELVNRANILSQKLDYYAKLPSEAMFDEWFNGEDFGTLDNVETILAKMRVVQDFYRDVIARGVVYVKDDYLKNFLKAFDWSHVFRKVNELSDKASYYVLDVDAILDTYFSNNPEYGVSAEDRTAFIEAVNILRDSGLSLREALMRIAETYDFDGFEEAIDANTNLFTDPYKTEFVDNLDAFIDRIIENPASLESELGVLIKYLTETTRDDGTPIFSVEMLKAIPDSEFNTVNSPEQFIEKLFTEGTDIFKFIRDTNDLISKVEPSPILELLQNVGIALTGQPSKILDLIVREKGLVSAQRFEYSLGSNAAEEIYNAQAILNILSSLIESASGGLNELVNTKRSVAGKTPLSVMDDNTRRILANEIDFVQRQLNAFRNLSEHNLGNKISENKNIAKYDSVKRFRRLISPEEGNFEYLVQQALTSKFSDFTSFADLSPRTDFDYDSVQNWSDSDYAEFYKAESAFKQNLFNWFAKLEDDIKSKVIKTIAEAASDDVEIINVTADEFSSDSETITGSWGNVRYLLSNLTTDFIEFQGFYKTATDELTDFLPFYGQETVTRDVYSSFIAKDYYNQFMDILLTKLKGKKSDDKFITGLKLLRNYLFIDGVPGSGKSTAVASILTKILRKKFGDKIKIVGLIHEDSGVGENSRKHQFAKNLGIPDTDCFIFSEFVEDNVYSGIRVANKSEETEHSKEIEIKNVKDVNKFGGDYDYYLFVADENTFANENQLNAFSEWTSKYDHGFLLGLGDMYQSGAETYKNSDVTDTYFQQTIRLTATFRAENTGKANNERTVREILKNAFMTWSRDRSVGAERIGKEVWESLGAFSIKPLIGYTDEKGLIYGDVSIEQTEIRERISKLLALEEKPSICIISDNPNEYKEFEASGVVVLDPKMAQGGQWDYCFVDSQINFQKEGKDNYINLKKFYTIMTRAKHGTAWVKSKLDKIGFEKSDLAKTPVGEDMRLESARQEYIKWRKSLFDLLPLSGSEGEAPSSSPTPSPSPTPGPILSVDDIVEEAKRLYTPCTEEEVVGYRKRLYEDDTTDPEVLAFREKHKSWIRDYRERKSKVETGEAMDFDFWWNWIANDDNLRDRCPIDFSDTVKESYRYWLQTTQDFLLRYSAIEDQDEKDLMLAELEVLSVASELQTLHKAVFESLKNNTGRIFVRNVGDSLTNMLYYICEDTAGNIKTIPLFARRNSIPGKMYKFSEANIGFGYKAIPISSNGGKFVEIDNFTKKTGRYNQVVVFKGFGKDSSHNLSKDAEAFSERNEGKAFILIDNISGNKSFETWPEYLGIRYSEGGSEVDSFVDENGNLYMRLIGVQKCMTTEDFKRLCVLLNTARYAKTTTEYEEATKALEELLKVNSIHVYNYNLKPKRDDGETSIKDLIPNSVTTYLLNVFLRNNKGSLERDTVLKSWMNGTSKSNAIALETTSGNRMYVTLHSSDGKLNVSWKSRTLQEGAADTAELSIDLQDEKYANLNPLNYWIEVFTDVIETTDGLKEYVSGFGIDVTDRSSINKSFRELVSKKVGNKFALNFDFGYVGSDEQYHSSDLSASFAAMASKSEWDEISKIFDLFKHEINMKITADQWDERPESKGVWGIVTEENRTGLGADIVDIIPPTYTLEFGDPVDELVPEFENSYSGDSNINIKNRRYTIKKSGDTITYKFNGNIEVNNAWINDNCVESETTIIQGVIDNVEETNGIRKVNIKYPTTSGTKIKTFTLKASVSDDFMSQFEEDAYIDGELKLVNDGINTETTYKGQKVVKTLGFKIKDSELYAILLLEGDVYTFAPIKFDTRAKIGNSLSNLGEVVYMWEQNGSMYGVYLDDKANFYFVSDLARNPSTSSLNVDYKNRTVNGVHVDDFDLFVNNYNGMIDDRGLSTIVDEFKKNVRSSLKLEEPFNSEINVILSVSDSKEDLITELNNYFATKAYRLGVKYTVTSDGKIAPNSDIKYQIGRKIYEKLDGNLEITSIETSNSEEFLVTLQNIEDNEITQQTWLFSPVTSDVSPKINQNVSIESSLMDLYNICYGLEGFTDIWTLNLETLSSISPSSIHSQLDALLEEYGIDPNVEEYVNRVRKVLENYC